MQFTEDVNIFLGNDFSNFLWFVFSETVCSGIRVVARGTSRAVKKLSAHHQPPDLSRLGDISDFVLRLVCLIKGCGVPWYGRMKVTVYNKEGKGCNVDMLW